MNLYLEIITESIIIIYSCSLITKLIDTIISHADFGPYSERKRRTVWKTYREKASSRTFFSPYSLLIIIDSDVLCHQNSAYYSKALEEMSKQLKEQQVQRPFYFHPSFACFYISYVEEYSVMFSSVGLDHCLRA